MQVLRRGCGGRRPLLRDAILSLWRRLPLRQCSIAADGPSTGLVSRIAAGPLRYPHGLGHAEPRWDIARSSPLLFLFLGGCYGAPRSVYLPVSPHLVIPRGHLAAKAQSKTPRSPKLAPAG